MFQRFFALFAILALAAAFAGTVPAPGGSYKVTFTQPSVVKGNDFKPGDYRINISPDKVTIVNGKNAVEVPAKIETAETKFSSTAIRYKTEAGKAVISEIRIGGTKTTLLFE
jgi:hypothetical protein